MNFSNFNPNDWTDNDLDKLIELWVKFEEVAKSCKKVDEKIIEASQTNDSLKRDIEASTNRCNEIIEKEHFISLESSREIIELSKNIRNVRKQEDEIEQKISEYKEELVSLRKQKDSIIEEINDLSKLVQGNSLGEPVEIKGNVEILDIPNLQNFEPVTVSLDDCSVITTKKSAGVILASTYKSAVNNLKKMADFLVSRISSSGLVKNIENINEEVRKSQQEIDQRMKNYLAALEAIELAQQTEKELKESEEIRLNMQFIGEKKEMTDTDKEAEVDKQGLKDLKEELVKDSLNAEDTKEEVSPVEVAPKAEEVKEASNVEDTKEEVSPIDVAPKAEEVKEASNAEDKKEEVSPVEVAPKAEEVKEASSAEDTKEEVSPIDVAPKAEEVKEASNAEDKKEEVSPIDVTPKAEEVKGLVVEAPKLQEEVTPMDMTQNATEQVTPLNINQGVQTSNENVTPISVEPPKDEPLDEPIAVKLATIANANQSKASVIESVYQKTAMNLSGVSPIMVGTKPLGYIAKKPLKSVETFFAFNEKYKSLRSTGDVGDIFGNNNAKVQTLSLR